MAVYTWTGRTDQVSQVNFPSGTSIVFGSYADLLASEIAFMGARGYVLTAGQQGPPAPPYDATRDVITADRLTTALTTVMSKPKVLAVMTSGTTPTLNRVNEYDASSGLLSQALPTGGAEGDMVHLRKVDATSNKVTFTGTGGPFVLGQTEEITLVLDSSGTWHNLMGYRPPNTYLTDFSTVDVCKPPYNLRPGDDATTTIQNLINAAATALTRNIEIYFSVPGVYTINGANQTGTAQGYSYNGQILLPAVQSANAMSLKIRGASQSPSAIPNVINGVVLRSNATSGSIIDAIPGFMEFTKPWTEITLMTENISFQVPSNPSAGGINVSQTKRYRQRNVNICAYPENPTLCTGAKTVYGLNLPQVQNSAEIVIEGMNMIRGFPVGIKLSEHLTLNSIYIAACQAAFRCGGVHANWFGHVRVESCPVIFYAENGDGGCTIDGSLDYENGNTNTFAPVAIIDSPYDAFLGALNLYFGAGFVNGGLGSRNCRQLDLRSSFAQIKPWKSTHPNDNFSRAVALSAAAATSPGMAWPSLHPWRVFTGTLSAGGGQLKAGSGSQATALLPCRDGGVTRTVNTTFTPATSYHVQQYVGFVNGGTPNVIIAQITGGNVNLVVNGTQRGTAAPTITVGTSYTVRTRVVHDPLGLPTSVIVYFGTTPATATSIITYTLTAAESQALAQGSDAVTPREDGITFFDANTPVTRFWVND